MGKLTGLSEMPIQEVERNAIKIKELSMQIFVQVDHVGAAQLNAKMKIMGKSNFFSVPITFLEPRRFLLIVGNCTATVAVCSAKLTNACFEVNFPANQFDCILNFTIRREPSKIA